MPLAEHFAQQRAGGDADRKNHQQQRGHLLVAVHDFFCKAGKLTQKHRTKKPHPADAQHGTKHYNIAARQLEVAPGLGDRVPVDPEVRVGGWRQRDELRNRAAQQRQPDTGYRHISRPNLRNGNDQTADDIAQQDRHKGAHLDHAVATRQLAFIERLRQIGKLHRPKQCGMQPHQKGAT